MLPYLVLAMAVSGSTPAEQGIFRGTVLDPSGLPIPKAIVTLTSATANPVSVRADNVGTFEALVSPGKHGLRIDAAGFEPLQRAISVAVGAHVETFVMEPRRVTERVEVTSPADYRTSATLAGSKTSTALIDLPQSIVVTRKEQIRDQLMMSMGDLIRYVPGAQVHQGENNRDQIILRGNNSSADFFVNGVRDDAQYYRDLYNLDRVEALKGPNAMIFGRGGVGGVINRVTKEAQFFPVREVVTQGGTRDHRRLAGDFNQPLTSSFAVRLNGMAEHSDSFRRGVELDRYGVNPVLTFAPNATTRLTLSYERLNDQRVADRGITSFQGVPADVDITTYYGNAKDSRVRATVDIGSLAFEKIRGRFTIRNRLNLGHYDRFYQNYVPGAVTPDKARVALTAYNNATERTNAFNQTDIIVTATHGRLKQTILAGAEVGRQTTGNFRNTGFFNNSTTSLSVPYLEPTITTPVTFRQSATDANNHLKADVAAAYLQDQIDFASKVQIFAGLRFDRFSLRYDNKRDGSSLDRTDDLVSPRVGIVLKPAPALSFYASHTVSHLPSSGDQFSSLTTITEQVKPERIRNHEVGVKWDPRPGLSLTGALYRLDRSNTRSTDPNDPTRIVQTGSQRTGGMEIGIVGALSARFRVAGGYALQNASITSATAAARLGARVAQVPRHSFSLWNHYQGTTRFGVALGVINRSEVFAAIDNTVRLPGYTRVDGAAFYLVTRELRLQANVENALDRKYWSNADGNTNISPGAGRTLRVALTASF